MESYKINKKNFIVGKYYFCNKNLYMKTRGKKIAFIKGKKYLFAEERYGKIIFIDEMKQNHSIYNFEEYNEYSWIKYFDDGRNLKLKKINGNN